MKITCIGAGNVAYHLTLALEKVGHSIIEIYSRTKSKALHLSTMMYNAQATDSLDFADSPAELFILAVSDDALEDVCSKIVLPENAIVVHTSGTRPLDDLIRLMDIHHDLPVRCGVFYPLMTFTMGKRIEMSEVPFCIEANEKLAENQLVKIAQQMSNTVYLVSSAERQVLHVAAVFACNFTNHLLALAKEIVDSEDLEFDLLKPLIKETIKKAMVSEHPANGQTGPAIRGDQSTINKHLAYLSTNTDLTKVYQTLSNSIQYWKQ